MQFDEKWDFVGKKEAHCEPGEGRCGDCWDHVAFDPESRLVVSLVVGKRTAAAKSPDSRTTTCLALTQVKSCVRLPLFSASAAARLLASTVSGAENPLVT